MAKKKNNQAVQGRTAFSRDPDIWARMHAAKPPNMCRILGLDLSTTTGAAWCDLVLGQPVHQAVILGSQWDLRLSTHDTQGLRFLRLQRFLKMAAPDLIVYEEVKYTGVAPASGVKMSMQAMVARAVTGAQAVHSLCAVMLTWAEARRIPVQSVPIGTLKKYATGSGSANKADMVTACNSQFGTTFQIDDLDKTGADNIADSMFLCRMAVEEYASSLDQPAGENHAD